MFTHVELTDGHGESKIELKLIDVDDENQLFATENVVQFDDPRAVVTFTVLLRNVTFPKPGEYRLQLFADNEFVMERRILALLIEKGGTNDGT